MKKCLKADFYRLFHDKVFLISLIVVSCLGVMTVLGNVAIKYFLMSLLEEGDTALLSISYNGKNLFVSALNPTNNVGLIVPIMVGIMVCKEFSYGTMRNKIISGAKRYKIVLSSFITMTTFSVIMVGLYAIINLGLGSLLLGYGSSMSNSEIFDLLGGFAVLLLVYATFTMILLFLAFTFKKLGVTIIIFIAFSFGISVVSSIYMISGLPDFILEITKFSPVYQTGEVANVNVEMMTRTIVSNLVYTGAFFGLTTLLFNRSDLK